MIIILGLANIINRRSHADSVGALFEESIQVPHFAEKPEPGQNRALVLILSQF